MMVSIRQYPLATSLEPRATPGISPWASIVGVYPTNRIFSIGIVTSF